MEHEGWNYDNARINGKNVFFFMDTSHINEGIKKKLFSELELKINKGFFQLLFVEGFSGRYNPKFPKDLSEKEFLEQCSDDTQKYSPIKHLSFRLQQNKNTDFYIHGIEDLEAYEKQLAIISLIVEFAKKEKSGTLSYEEYMASLMANKIFDEYTDERSIIVARNIIKNMNEWNVNTAGVVFGEHHYDLMVKELLKENIGTISYYPGKITSGHEEIFEYVASILEI
ncbi:MAG: hypothetical protein WC867_05665 [Candidatus Pacearchaeota archaeon]|jgi:hypothetical protein